MAGDREVRIRFTGESAALKGSFGDVRTLFQAMQDDVNDTRLAGDQLATAYETVAANLKTRLAELDSAAEVLAESLGPEMVAAIEASGGSVVREVEKFERMGLTLDDIKASSDQLATAMKTMDEAARRSTGEVGDGFKRIAGEADNSRSVVANFAGNAIQELPGVAGAFGPLNMAISQFVEYGVEGNINMKNLALAAGPLAAVSLVMGLIANESKRAADEQKRFQQTAVSGSDTAVMQAFASAVKDAADYAERTANTNWTGLIVTTDDTKQKMNELRKEFEALVEEQPEGARRMFALAQATGQYGAEVALLAEVINDYEQGQIQAKATQDQFGATLNKTADEWAGYYTAMNQAWQAQRDGVDTSDQLASGLDVLATVTEGAAEKTNQLFSAQLSLIDAGFAARDAQDQFATSLANLSTAADDPTTQVDEYRVAVDDAARAALSLADANVRQATEMANASGATLSSAEQNAILVQSLRDVVAWLEPGSPLRTQLEGYITQLEGVDAASDINGSVKISGVVDAKDRLEELGAAADDVADETNTTSNADTATAETRLQNLQTAAEDVPDNITIGVGTPNTQPAIGELSRLETKVNDVITAGRTLQTLMRNLTGI
jgi:hypothetical protein